MTVTEAIVSDTTGSIKVVWFNQPYLTKNIRVGDVVRLSGSMSEHEYDPTLLSPMYEKSTGGSATHTGRLVPVYSVVSGITPRQLRTWIKYALETCLDRVRDLVPRELLKTEHLVSLHDALRNIHFPESVESAEGARKRLIFDEVLFVHLENIMLRHQHERLQSPTITFHEHETKKFIESLPFSLTKDQREAIWQIVKDMSREIPMNRLLEGDVGSGKTIVAAIAALNAILSGFQVAYMAPTEVLAGQVFESMRRLFKDGPSVGLLTSSRKQVSGIGCEVSNEKRKKLIDSISCGDIQIVIGTHALLEERVTFPNLGLAIVDEQHRFGVRQRQGLRTKNENKKFPHLLSMTATPIPRSLALSMYGDLDVSVLQVLPKGRLPIITKVVPKQYREWTYDFIRRQVRAGRQAFVICPLIGLSEALQVKAVKDEYRKLSQTVFPDLSVGMLHGKMKPKEKAKVFEDMLGKKIDILVSTSVIEVGIDIANATVILIEGAERFGLAQLHQFRGRVGRSEHQSYCFLAPSDPKDEHIDRLSALVDSTNGFELAEKDLELRGSGDFFGIRQSGLPMFKIATLADLVHMKSARTWAEKIMEQLDHYPLIKKRLEDGVRDVHRE